MTPTARISEDELLAAVLELAKFAGFRCHHVRPAWSQKGYRTPLQGEKGFPDLVICGKGRFLIVELKTDFAKLTDHQSLWMQAMETAGVETAVWRPVDWFDGTIAKALRCEGGVIRHDPARPRR